MSGQNSGPKQQFTLNTPPSIFHVHVSLLYVDSGVLYIQLKFTSIHHLDQEFPKHFEIRNREYNTELHYLSILETKMSSAQFNAGQTKGQAEVKKLLLKLSMIRLFF